MSESRPVCYLCARALTPLQSTEGLPFVGMVGEPKLCRTCALAMHEEPTSVTAR